MYLPLTKLHLILVEQLDLECSEYHLSRGHMVAVSPQVHHRHSLLPEELEDIFRIMIGGVVHHDDGVSSPVPVLCVKGLDQLGEEELHCLAV